MNSQGIFFFMYFISIGIGLHVVIILSAAYKKLVAAVFDVTTMSGGFGHYSCSLMI